MMPKIITATVVATKGDSHDSAPWLWKLHHGADRSHSNHPITAACSQDLTASLAVTQTDPLEVLRATLRSKMFGKVTVGAVIIVTK